MEKSTLKNIFLNLMLILIPLLIGLQSFVPKSVELVIIAIKLVIAPILIILLLNNLSIYLRLLVLIIYITILALLNPPLEMDDFQLVFLSVISSLTYFYLGKQIVNNGSDKKNFKYLAYGVNIFNIITLFTYFLALLGYINISELFTMIGREDDIDLFRFSLGNAIEVPFTMTCILFAAMVLLDGSKNLMFSISLNLIVAFISQSRVVVLIALILFIYEFLKINWKYKVVFVALIIVLIPTLFFYIEDTYISLIDRLKGDDSGSAQDRFMLYNLFIDNITFIRAVLGEGLTSSSALMKYTTGTYRSMESVFLQIIFDLGIVGFIMYLLPILKSNVNFIFKGRYRFALLFVFIQIIFFLPIYTSMITTFFLFGVCAKKNALNDKVIIDNYQI